MILRHAKDSDFDFLIEGLEAVRTLECRPEKDIPANEYDRQKYKDAIAQKRVRVFEDNGEPVAFLHYRTDFEVMLIHEPFFWIDLIYVRQDHRRQGLAEKLYEDAIKIAKAKGFKRIVLDVFAVNKVSQSFHEKMGFEPLYSIYHKMI